MKLRSVGIAAGVLIAAAAGALGPSNVAAAAPQEPQLLQGSVADAATLEAVPGATVTLVTTGSVTQSEPDGSFAFPQASPGRASLRIEAPGYQTTVWEVEIVAGRVVPLEVRLSRPQEPGTLRVVVRADDSGEPLAGAAVSIPELGISTATDQTGGVVFPGVPPGSFRVLVSSVGYASLDSSVELEDASVAFEVALRSVPIGLDPVVVEGQADFNQRLDDAGFYQRRTAGLGQFLDRADIERASPVMPSELFRLMPGVQMVSLGRGTPDFALTGRRGFDGFRDQDNAPDGPSDPDAGCRMQLFVDGLLHRMDGAESYNYDTGESELRVVGATLDQLVPVESIEAIEVYSSTSRLPQQFNVAGAQCGAVLVWTRRESVAPAPAGAAAPIEREVQLGDEVRIASELASGQFRVAEAGPSGLTLRADEGSESIEVPAAAITGLEVSLGRSVSAKRGLFYGSLTGALGGVVVLVTCHMPHFVHYGCFGGASAEAGALMSLGLGSIVGLVISLTSDEVWAGGRLPP